LALLLRQLAAGPDADVRAWAEALLRGDQAAGEEVRP
jgi:hypothetical protein